MDSAKSTFSAVLRDGQKLAESGPAELDVQRMLERIDDVAANYKQVNTFNFCLKNGEKHFFAAGQGNEKNG